MLGQRDSCMGIAAPAYEKELQERYKRSVWDDLIFAIQLLKNFDEELKKLHPDVTHRIRQIMN
jgi:hypothetical protein